MRKVLWSLDKNGSFRISEITTALTQANGKVLSVRSSETACPGLPLHVEVGTKDPNKFSQEPID